MKNEPLVSIIRGVYNTKTEYLRIAMDSILDQSYSNIEFIIVDDASDDWCSKFLMDYRHERKIKYEDNRIRLIRNTQNKGLTVTLNIALQEAKGDYVARMDADDICFKNRIKRQVLYMNSHEEIDVLACVSFLYSGKDIVPLREEFARKSQFTGVYREFAQERIRIRLSFSNIEFAHPTVMFRKKFLEDNGIKYAEDIKIAQDYNMWVRCIEHGKLYCQQEVLFISRIYGNRISNIQQQEQRNFADVTKIRCMTRLLPDSTERQKELYTHMRDVEIYGNVEENINLIRLLVSANDRNQIYDPDTYKQELFFWWLRKSLYKINRPQGKKILMDQYMFTNIIKIILPQSWRYIKDIFYKHRMKRKWLIEMKGFEF